MAKSKAAPPKYYFDACLFLALINEDGERFKIVEAILDDAENNAAEVHTSRLSVVEVAFGESEKKGKALSAAAERKIDKLWHPSSPIRISDVHGLVTLEARSLMRQAMAEGWNRNTEWSLKPPDAIHLATAKVLKVAKFFTYDSRLKKLDKLSGCDVCEPFLTQGRIGVGGSGKV